MSDILWETSALIAAMRARPIGTKLPEGVTGLSIDSRTLSPGEAFFAIAGDRFDGHDFLTAANKAGAALHVVSERKLAALGRVNAPMLVVDDVLAALGRLADAARARSRASIVAVTGSVGKTTTKEALRHGLAASGSVHASAASFNNHWGVPLSLARLPAETRFAVFEIGMNHPDEIRPLVKLVRPNVAVVTLIAPAHLGNFRDIDQIVDAKAEIFEGLVVGGTAVINADDPKCGRLAEAARAAGAARIATFGEAGGADFRLTAFAPDGDGARLEAEIAGAPVSLHLSMSGRHMAQNVLAVLGIADLMGADVLAVADRLASWQAVKGRGVRIALSLADGGAATLIDDSYNANPASVRAAIDTLALANIGENGRRIAVLGDMKELGTHAPALHAALAEPLITIGIDRVLLVGEEMRALEEALGDRLDVSWHESVEALSERLSGELRDGDVVSVKGSRSIGLERLVDGLAARFSAGEPEPDAPAATPAPDMGGAAAVSATAADAPQSQEDAVPGEEIMPTDDVASQAGPAPTDETITAEDGGPGEGADETDTDSESDASRQDAPAPAAEGEDAGDNDTDMGQTAR